MPGARVAAGAPVAEPGGPAVRDTAVPQGHGTTGAAAVASPADREVSSRWTRAGIRRMAPSPPHRRPPAGARPKEHPCPACAPPSSPSQWALPWWPPAPPSRRAPWRPRRPSPPWPRWAPTPRVPAPALRPPRRPGRPGRRRRHPHHPTRRCPRLVEPAHRRAAQLPAVSARHPTGRPPRRRRAGGPAHHGRGGRAAVPGHPAAREGPRVLERPERRAAHLSAGCRRDAALGTAHQGGAPAGARRPAGGGAAVRGDPAGQGGRQRPLTHRAGQSRVDNTP